MTAAKQRIDISVDDYLNGEAESTIKHEYLDGAVYAMAGGSNRHTLVKTNTTIGLGMSLRDKPCRVYDSDAKIRIRLDGDIRFYYPDASVICDPNPASDTFQDSPVVIAEVLSESTRRIDERERKGAYLSIPSLAVYLLIEQESPTVVTYRRTNGDFEREVYDGMDAVIPLPEIDAVLPLREIYANVEFSADSNE